MKSPRHPGDPRWRDDAERWCDCLPVDWRKQSISAGDLVFTSAVGDPDLITHVGIALDSRRCVHAVGFGRTVSIGALPRSERIMAVQRIALP